MLQAEELGNKLPPTAAGSVLEADSQPPSHTRSCAQPSMRWRGYEQPHPVQLCTAQPRHRPHASRFATAHSPRCANALGDQFRLRLHCWQPRPSRMREFRNFEKPPPPPGTLRTRSALPLSDSNTVRVLIGHSSRQRRVRAVSAAVDRSQTSARNSTDKWEATLVNQARPTHATH